MPGVRVIRGAGGQRHTTARPRALLWECYGCVGRVQAPELPSPRGAGLGVARAGSAHSHLPCNPGLLLCHDPKFSWCFSSFEMLGRSGVEVSWARGGQPAGCPAMHPAPAVAVTWSLGKEGCVHPWLLPRDCM